MFPSLPQASKPSNSFVRSKSTNRTLISQHSTIPDVSAKLVCELVAPRHWRLFLTEIVGRKVSYLLGREYGLEECLFLDTLLPIRIREMHQQKVDEILNEGNQSAYWKSLFENMLGRRIKICNPLNDQPRFIKILMNSEVKQGSSIVFSVIFIDETSNHLISLEQLENAHDVRALMRLGIKSITESPISRISKDDFLQQNPQQMAQWFDQFKERDEQLLDVMEMSMSIFKKDGHQKLEGDCFSSIELIIIDDKVNEFLDAEAKEKLINISSIGASGLMLPYNLISILKLILNQMIQCCLQQQISQIYIQHRTDDSLYICDLYVSQALCFLEENLQPYINEWKIKGGQLEHIAEHNVLISIPAVPRFNFFNPDEVIPEMNSIMNEVKMNPEIPVVFLVDDVILNIKVLINTCIRFMKIHEQVNRDLFQTVKFYVTQNSWQDKKLISVNCGGVIFICCANGDIASKALRNIPGHGMITDMEMPGTKNGESLILWLKAHELRNHLEPMKVLVNTALNIDQYLEKHPRLNQIGVPYVCKGSENFPIQMFVKETLDKFFASQYQINSLKMI